MKGHLDVEDIMDRAHPPDVRIETIHRKSQQSAVKRQEAIVSFGEAYELGGADGRKVRRVGEKHEPTPTKS